MQGFKHFWIGIVDFQRMENRKEYWTAILLNSITILLLIILGIFIRIVMPYIALIYAIVSILPTISMTVRRLHDVDESGFYMFFIFIPIGGAIMILLKIIKPTQYYPQTNNIENNAINSK
jgi:uncharacterized membrane protein YhaH (DUF805 family)